MFPSFLVLQQISKRYRQILVLCASKNYNIAHFTTHTSNSHRQVLYLALRRTPTFMLQHFSIHQQRFMYSACPKELRCPLYNTFPFHRQLATGTRFPSCQKSFKYSAFSKNSIIHLLTHFPVPLNLSYTMLRSEIQVPLSTTPFSKPPFTDPSSHLTQHLHSDRNLPANVTDFHYFTCSVYFALQHLHARGRTITITPTRLTRNAYQKTFPPRFANPGPVSTPLHFPLNSNIPAYSITTIHFSPQIACGTRASTSTLALSVELQHSYILVLDIFTPALYFSPFQQELKHYMPTAFLSIARLFRHQSSYSFYQRSNCGAFAHFFRMV